MRHRLNTKTLDRKTGPRKALVRTQLVSVIQHKSIVTTKAKAKYIKPKLEKLITSAREGTLAARRELLKNLDNKKAVSELMDVIAPAHKNRPGGYTRIVAMGRRVGDGAELVKLEIVDNDKMVAVVKTPAKSKTKAAAKAKAKPAAKAEPVVKEKAKKANDK